MAYLTRQQAMDIINKAPSNLNKETLLKELARTNTIEGYNEPEKKSSFLSSVAKPSITLPSISIATGFLSSLYMPSHDDL